MYLLYAAVSEASAQRWSASGAAANVFIELIHSNEIISAPINCQD